MQAHAPWRTWRIRPVRPPRAGNTARCLPVFLLAFMMESAFVRFAGRQPNQLRPIRITRHYTRYAEGSVLIE